MSIEIARALLAVDLEAAHCDAEFNAAIHALAEMLVPMVRGLAGECRARRSERQQQMNLLMRGER